LRQRYLDCNATCAATDAALAAVIQASHEAFGNPSSLHWAGRAARRVLDDARDTLAAYIGTEPGAVVFTSGGTEANNMAIFGTLAGQSPGRIVTTAIEHHAVLRTAEALQKEGGAVAVVPVTGAGRVDVAALGERVDDTTALVSVMLANNETGVLQPVSEVAALAHERGAIVHCDAVQAAGKAPVNVAELGVDLLVTIGGDDTAHTAHQIDTLAGPQIEVAHVPKTIDNDLPLPGSRSTFGYQTARHLGTSLVQNIMEDAMTTTRWYYIVAMGRSAGHLAMGIGKAASATLVLIPEEFRGNAIVFSHLCDILETSVIKRKVMGRDYGVAILAEGLAEDIPPEDLEEIEDVERDDHGNIRLAEIELGVLVKNEVRRRLKARGINLTVVPKNIGYELRCCPPIPYDMEYTQDLGFAAVRYLLEGNTGALICIIEGKLVPIKFEDLQDSDTGKTRIRRVDVDADFYRVAREYMIRLERADFVDHKKLARLARVANMAPEDFRERFGYLGEPW